MASLNVLALVCLSYVALLFIVAFAADRHASHGRPARWMRSPLIYTLSLSIYCTAWTFYGAVGYAARSGLEYITIYLGPTLVMVGWWWGLRKLVRIGRSQRITSIADLLSARYGKSNLLAIGVTILAVIGTTPYISLQLQSITLSFSIFAEADPLRSVNETQTVFWVAAGLAAFAILFGTRNLNANERHHGVVTAVALEAVVKLVSLLAVGIFVVWGIAGGVGETMARIDASSIGQWQVDGGRWATITFLSAAAFVCLPRMFQVMVVENEDERHLRVAAWAFPLYLLLISIFVVPIAAIGLELLPVGSNPDLFVLTLPLAEGQQGLAMLSFLGGFSSATSMAIVAAMALSTMVSNHIVMPIWLRWQEVGASVSGDVRHVVLLSRRLSIAGIMALGYFYYTLSGGGAALAAIGLISFTGISQMLPSLVGGLFWRGATRSGALAGLSVGFAIWLYTMLLPELGGGLLPAHVLADGVLGLSWLRPHALFGIEGLDPTVHAVLWSMALNTAAFLIGSLLTFPSPMERLQGAQFVHVFDHSSGPRGWTGSVAQSEDLMVMSQRILGAGEAQKFFQSELTRQGGRGPLPEPTPAFLERLERELSASIGAAAAHAMVGQIVGGSSVSVQDLLAVADETAQILEYSNRLETQSEELSRTARKLQETNEKLTQLSQQKDAFLSQVSHELRTPMTSIRAFSEILRDTENLASQDHSRYAGIIHDEAQRLTRLLNDLLDLSVLENGQVSLNISAGRLGDVLDHAVATALADGSARLRVERDAATDDMRLSSDLDRLAQVFINLIANADKYCTAADPQLRITARQSGHWLFIDFIDNGDGIPPAFRTTIFEKFSRVSPERAGGAGLGLAICREIMQRLGGDVAYLSGEVGGAFQVSLPLRQENPV
ncbi:sensor histidine kinase [Phaeobacter inhibens]|uniref:histidine kinase n=1 Tax=Phaeobacter inhibens TaxID=221822 RepID=A0A2I7H8T6_9RHOB|nr:sensor histidine kinase [Phaeobacter inhibens]AUQ58206.1 two-component system sensor histidine kinase [Phaeobacter inhibens]AUQ62251.1 two-component system sensor histidine kinase [Phaeobacter inhibens]AUQ82201.1 two-component system sensor histidine kinase [Phaeobacter inhibens]AUQ89962.1 two-component system sensor histidine kinase [Phaeobacter inhibens]AUQ98713.1 two-component system sensor histidine kinase [Phaeobacter inhibens]